MHFGILGYTLTRFGVYFACLGPFFAGYDTFCKFFVPFRAFLYKPHILICLSSFQCTLECIGTLQIYVLYVILAHFTNYDTFLTQFSTFATFGTIWHIMMHFDMLWYILARFLYVTFILSISNNSWNILHIVVYFGACQCIFAYFDIFRQVFGTLLRFLTNLNHFDTFFTRFGIFCKFQYIFENYVTYRVV